MAMDPGPDDEMDRDAQMQADAMKAQLRKDVVSWSKARAEETQLLTDSPMVPPVAPPAAKPAPAKSTAARAAKQAAAAPKKAANTAGKPFRMSYSGGTTADYIKYMLDRGAK
jgi:hypothetical protein